MNDDDARDLRCHAAIVTQASPHHKAAGPREGWSSLLDSPDTIAGAWAGRRIEYGMREARTALRGPLVAMLASLVGGGVVALALCAALYQLIFPSLCAINGELWAAWAQVVAIALTGSAAVWVAWTQLRKFNENERAKTTVKYLQLYSSSTTEIPNTVSLTPEAAVAYIEGLLSDDTILSRVRAVAARMNGLPSPLAAVTPELEQEYVDYFAAFSVAANFFSKTAGLAREGLIDGRLFLDFYAIQVVTLWRFIQKFADVDPRPLTLKQNQSLRMFAEQASAAFTSDPKPEI